MKTIIAMMMIKETKKISIISDLKKEQFRILERNKPFNLSPPPPQFKIIIK